MRNKDLLMIGAITAGVIFLSKGKIGKFVGENVGETIGGAVGGTVKGLAYGITESLDIPANTVDDRNFQNFILLPMMGVTGIPIIAARTFRSIKSLGDPTKYWS